jgi:hypothetical protein
MSSGEKVIELLLEIAREEIIVDFNKDSCIASAAVAIDVLSHYHILANPLPVRVIVCNKAMVDRVNLEDRLPRDQAESKKWEDECGAYSIGIGYGAKRIGKWPGHLVALTEDNLMIDLSIDQANRPHRDIFLHPFAAQVDEEFLRGEVSCTGQINDCMLKYDAVPGNDAFRQSPNWCLLADRKAVVDRILKRIQLRL